MSEAEMVGWAVIALATIAGLYCTVSKPMVQNQKVMTKLTCTMEQLSEKLTKLESNNHDSHRRLWEKNEAQDKMLNDHEMRIHELELKEEEEE